MSHTTNANLTTHSNVQNIAIHLVNHVEEHHLPKQKNILVFYINDSQCHHKD